MDTPTEETVETKQEKLSFGARLDRLVSKRWFSHAFLVALLVYLIVCGYVLVFSGSLFVEAVSEGWYRARASEYDSESFLLGYLYGFASLMGVIGALAVLSSRPHRYFRHKVLMFFPSVIWSTLLVVDILRWGSQYIIQLVFLVPIMLVCFFVFFGVVKRATVPYLLDKA
ncbi:MAG: hypothetical protein J7M24_04860 [Candidatus Latescibacteria bacterium]|nr:hypothetical protein [Candidatus Latescibacterota bacterium]